MSAFQQSAGSGIFGGSRPVTGGHSTKCVCTICECGRHKCPPGRHHQAHYDADAMRSTYGKDFPSHGDVRRPAIRHPSDSHVRSNEPFDHKTTHSLDYSGHPGARPSSPYRPPAGTADRGLDDRDFKSEGASQYGAKPGRHKRESFAPKGASIVSGVPFDGTSTSKTDFPGWRGVKPPAPYKLGDSVLRPAGENRDFKSEAAGHYTDKSHPGMGARRANPTQQRGPSLPFEGQSTHATDFRGTGGKPATPVVPKLMFQSQPEDRDFMSESHGKHDDKGIQPRVANRGMHQVPPSLPFNGQSTHATDFPGWAGARPSTSARPARSQLAAAPEDRDFRSETARNYDAKPLQPRHIARGGPGWQATPEERDFGTESKNNLNNKGYQKRDTMKPKATTHVQGLPFDGQSTAKTDFKEYPGHHAARPRHIAHRTTAGPEDRDFVTDARVMFPPRPTIPIPHHTPSADTTHDHTNPMAAEPLSPPPKHGHGHGEHDDGATSLATSSITSPSRRAGAAIAMAMAGGTPPWHAIPYNSSLDTAYANYGDKGIAPCPANGLEPRVPPAPGMHSYYVPNSTGRWTPIS